MVTKIYIFKISLLQIYRFPNFEKFRSLEVLNIYNMFDEEIINGSYFNYYDKSYKNIESLIKNSKNLKSIWLNGFDYTGSLSQHSKDEKNP